MNNDGRLDIYVCRFEAPNLLYINQGDGTFKEEARAYWLDERLRHGLFRDYDRDGPAVCLRPNQCPRRRGPSGGPAELSFPQQWQRHVHRRDRALRGLPCSRALNMVIDPRTPLLPCWTCIVLLLDIFAPKRDTGYKVLIRLFQWGSCYWFKGIEFRTGKSIVTITKEDE